MIAITNENSLVTVVYQIYDHFYLAISYISYRGFSYARYNALDGRHDQCKANSDRLVPGRRPSFAVI